MSTYEFDLMNQDLPPDLPLCADLDGTLLKSDTMRENVKLLLRKKPWTILPMLWWLRKGRPNFKKNLALRQELDVAVLPYFKDMLTWLQREKAKGRTIILASGTDLSIAQRVADHLGLFDQAMGSRESTNLTGSRKLAYLRDLTGGDEFIYVGDSLRDMPLWRQCRFPLAVNPKPKVLARLNRENINCGIIRAK